MKETRDRNWLTFREAAAILGVSYQTIWRYASTRNEERRIKSEIHMGVYHVSLSELHRFRDEIRPTFRGGPGRPTGSRNKKQGKHERFNLTERKATRMTHEQRLNYLLAMANDLLEET